jgi:hypothetical protein
MLNNLPSPVSGQRILPQEHLSFELEFFNFSNSLQTQAVAYDLKIEIDYLSTFPGVERYLSMAATAEDLMSGSSPPETETETKTKTDTVYIRK